MIAKPTSLLPEAFYTKYIEQAPGEELLNALEITRNKTLNFIEGLNAEQADFRYAEGKWTVKQALKHIADCERILSYRFLRLFRKDAQEFLGFDQDHYATEDYTAHLGLKDLAEDFEAVRNNSVQLIKNTGPTHLDFEGMYNNLPFSPRILGWMIAGHNAHHLAVFRDHYRLM